MNVLFISRCEKRARTRTLKILDSYANRVGDSTWITPITEEALKEVWALLKRSATRQTAVACYRNYGKQKMRLMWSVGSKSAFSSSGLTPIATRARKITMTPSLKLLLTMTQLAGLTHDLGKATKLFQAKLQNKLPRQDPIRHEWVSVHVLNHFIKTNSLQSAYEKLKWDVTILKELPFCKNQGITSSVETLQFMVATHHRLFGPSTAQHCGSSLTSDTFFEGWDKRDVSQETLFTQNPDSFLCAAGELNQSLENNIARHIKSLQPVDLTTTHPSPHLLKGIGIIGRAFLIMADHMISARKIGSEAIPTKKEVDPATIYANTRLNESAKVPQKNKMRVLNQTLNYHLENVGKSANTLLYHALNTNWDGLSEYTVEHILKPSSSASRFTWQDDAVEALLAAKQTISGPSLIMNVAGTGAGKTRMNAKAICALNTRTEVRFSTALGLKTLTLQTGDAFSYELGIPHSHLACIIGDRVAKKLHSKAYIEGQEPNDDENTDELEFDVSSESVLELPEILAEYAAITQNAKKLLAPAVLVSTIDYLIAAGEPNKQGHHALAIQRLMNSDLILDEIDDYSPTSFVAVLRLVEMAAMCGANIVTSSATLPKPMVAGLASAFYNGAKIYSEIHHKPCSPLAAVISNYTDPLLQIISQPADITDLYTSHINKSLVAMKANTHKKASIARIDLPSPQHFITTISKSIQHLHADNHWISKGRKISFGLVRVAHVKQVMNIANALGSMINNAYIAAYHADDFVIQRHLKEKILDNILTRKNGNQNIEDNSYIQSLIAHVEEGRDVIFVLVASPVEEVGRDHDFDWAVIEPSSLRSIVQTAGRVNRHRLVETQKNNIHILNYNFNCCANHKDCVSHIHYQMPGFETLEHPLDDHDISTYLQEEQLSNLNASLRLSKNPWSQQEDRAIHQILEDPIKVLTLTNKRNKTAWMSTAFYKKYPLRDNNKMRVFIYKNETFYEEIYNEAGYIEHLDKNDLFTIQCPPENTWLAWSLQDLQVHCETLGVRLEQGMKVYLQENSIKDSITYQEGFGFNKSGAIIQY